LNEEPGARPHPSRAPPLCVMKRLTITIAVLLAAAVAAPAAHASSDQLAIFQDDAALVQHGDAERQATLAELRSLGVEVIKAHLVWSEVAGHAKTKPRGFNGADPSQYPGWGAYDAFVQEAQARGFKVMLTITPPAPGWATKAKGDRAGVDRPSAREFGRFAQAAGARYPGVKLWAIGNEPNHKGFLYPQSTRGGVPVAPRLYRDLVRAAVSGLRRSGHTHDTILFGELLPIAPSARGPKRNLQPIVFIREFFCLDSRWRPFRGRAARERGCQHYKKLTGVTGFGYHPYTRPAGPSLVEPSANDATIRSLGRVTRALDIARSRGRVGGGRLPIWITEFGFQSNPPDHIFGAKLSRIPSFMGESELWLALRNRRVKSYSQYGMTDARVIAGNTSDWQSGLRFVNGTPKPGVYQAYRLPIFVRVLGPSAVEVRGDARPGAAGAVVQVQQRLRGSFKNLGAPISVRNGRGYFVAKFRVSSASKRRYRFLYQDLSSPELKPVVR
jgi:hypothetical protein